MFKAPDHCEMLDVEGMARGRQLLLEMLCWGEPGPLRDAAWVRTGGPCSADRGAKTEKEM